jgi:hypothetical protein
MALSTHFEDSIRDPEAETPQFVQPGVVLRGTSLDMG